MSFEMEVLRQITTTKNLISPLIYGFEFDVKLQKPSRNFKFLEMGMILTLRARFW